MAEYEPEPPEHYVAEYVIAPRLPIRDPDALTHQVASLLFEAAEAADLDATVALRRSRRDLDEQSGFRLIVTVAGAEGNEQLESDRLQERAVHIVRSACPNEFWRLDAMRVRSFADRRRERDAERVRANEAYAFISEKDLAMSLGDGDAAGAATVARHLPSYFRREDVLERLAEVRRSRPDGPAR